MRPVPAVASVFTRVTLAEIRKLFVSRLAWAGWIFLAALAAFGMFGIATFSVNVAEPNTGQGWSIPEGLAYTLSVRNFHLAQIWIAVLVATSVTGELATRTLREDLATAVPRWGVLLAKWVAIGAWSAVALLGHTLVGTLFGLGALTMGSGGAWGGWLTGVLGSLLGDLGFAAVALLVAVLARRVAVTIVALVIVMAVDRATTFALLVPGFTDPSVFEAVLPGVPVADIAIAILPYVPSSAFAVGSSLALGAAIPAATWLALIGWTALAGGLATLRFEQLDVL